MYTAEVMRQRGTYIAITLACAIAIALLSWLTLTKRVDTTPLMHADIVLTKDGFSPAEVWLVRGGSVTFSTISGKRFWPASDSHPAHTIYPEFDPKQPLEPSDSWTMTFNTIGDWGYHDHLRTYFIGIIHVQ